jgi:hypothetical protein
MLVGFALFDRLLRHWECLEVFPQGTVAVLHAHAVHKTRPGGVLAQLSAVASYTGWPDEPANSPMVDIGFGSQHDRLDAYLAAWIASLGEGDREALGRPPYDAIWVPKLSRTP